MDRFNSNYKPPEALRWLALTSGAEACEVLDYAGRALARSSRAPREVITKAIGDARREEVVGAATLELVKSLINILQSSQNVVFEENPGSLAINTSRLNAITSSSGSAARMLGRIENINPGNRSGVFTLINTLVDFGERVCEKHGVFTIYRGHANYLTDRGFLALGEYEKVMKSSPGSYECQIARSSCVSTLIDNGRFEDALELDSVQIKQCVPIVSLAHMVGRIAIATHIGTIQELNGALDYALDQIRDRHWQQVIASRIRYLIKDISSSQADRVGALGSLETYLARLED